MIDNGNTDVTPTWPMMTYFDVDAEDVDAVDD